MVQRHNQQFTNAHSGVVEAYRQEVERALATLRALVATSVADVSITTLLDDLDSTRGTILVRGASGWQGVDPGTASTVLTSNGPGADPTYQAAGGGSGIAFTLAAAMHHLGAA